MQQGISKGIFNTNHSLSQLVLITWFLLPQVWTLLFKLPLIKMAGAHMGMELKGCFLSQRPPRSALWRALLAPASWGSSPSPRRADRSSPPCNPKRPVSWPKAITAFQPVTTTGNPHLFFCMQFAYLELLITQVSLLLNDQTSCLQRRNFYRLQLVGFLCKFNSVSLPDVWLINAEETT